jgi:hypothetical protein
MKKIPISQSVRATTDKENAKQSKHKISANQKVQLPGS